MIVHLLILFLLSPVVYPTEKLGDKWCIPFEVGHPNLKVPSPHFLLKLQAEVGLPTWKIALHQPQRQKPRRLLFKSTAVKSVEHTVYYYLSLRLTNSSVQLLSVDMVLWCLYRQNIV